ncbi:tRNA (adenosine(37)-N6)-threonylcarbamoyltransferase complex ATPase subunit type 1 TsaE [Planctomicrobium sp. SH664]|uniref:tRNA (adenosine(37)-N6)-threonylcarbamoyltransferase complex ATPase subunit type 1 TsaE n=1 Tax=Planctomicrobium sp. SH664 TaxID=3448125 RepID=UPI003F5B0FE4
MLKLEAASLAETQRIGHALAGVLQAGDVVELNGDLGAGKTHLVQAIAAGLQVTTDFVHSPTFVLIQEYDGRLPVCHIDAYRLNDVDEFLELGADELLGADNVCLIEWGERVREVLPRDRLTVEIRTTGESSREFLLQSSGRRSERIVEELAQPDSRLADLIRS